MSSSSSTGSDGGVSDWDDQVDLATLSLFDTTTHSTPEAALQHDASHHGFDLGQRPLDTYQRMRLINLIRRDHLSPELALQIHPDDARLKDDALLTPVIPDDPLLQHSYDDAWSDDDVPVELPADSRANELSLLRQILNSEEPGPSPKVDHDTHYFDSYAENEIHEIMLKDTTRTNAYRRFIQSNPKLFQGAIVLDVGCGTGILSMFAARAGARKVYAVEASSLAPKTRAIIAANGLADIISVLHGKMEDLGVPEKVDIIVSEWMGYMLLYESMLDSVLNARDRFLKPGGLMVPSQAKVYLSGITGATLYKERIGFWSDIYGFDMSAMAPNPNDGLIETIPHAEVVTTDAMVRDIAIHSATPRSLDFSSPFTLAVTTQCTIRAFLTHFDVFFGLDQEPVNGPAEAPASLDTSGPAGPVTFTTGTRGPPTHWQQVAFLLRTPLTLSPGASIHGEFFCRKSSSNTRELDVEIHYTLDKGSERRLWEMMTYSVR